MTKLREKLQKNFFNINLYVKCGWDTCQCYIGPLITHDSFMLREVFSKYTLKSYYQKTVGICDR
jgi:hypothetical protein